MFYYKLRIIYFFMFIYCFANIKLIRKIKICLCTIGKKENLYAREFVNYYQKLGINKIFIYDNNDKNDEKFDLVLKDYIDFGFVKILDIRGKIAPQIKVMEECRKKNFKKFDWIIFFDMDEYIFLRNFSNIKDFLGQKIFDKCQSIQFLAFHYLNKNNIMNSLIYIVKSKLYHVPCFSFISFYFTYNIFLKRDTIKFKKRIERLLIPFIIWPIISYLSRIIIFQKTISLYNLMLQLILGSQFMVPLWYLFSMIFLNILFFIITNLFIEQFLLIISLLGISSYIIQYSGLYVFFDNFSNTIRYPLLHTLGIFPISIIGICFGSLKLIKYLENNRKTTLIFSYLFIYFLFKYNIFINLIGYHGIEPVFSSFFLFSGFYLFPLDNINPFIQKIIKKITSYTNGIYCLQTEISLLVRKLFFIDGNINSIIIIYLISYCISFIGIKIFGKTKLKFLFI